MGNSAEKWLAYFSLKSRVLGELPVWSRRRANHNITVTITQITDLLRHASYQITANIYDSAVSDEKREAHSGVIRLVTRASTRACQESGEAATA